MNVFLVAGGTGGHIMPALAFGQYLSQKDISVHYVCGSRSLELNIYKNHGVSPIVLPMDGSPFGVRLWGQRFMRFIKMLKSFFCFYSSLKSCSPEVCLLFGGYISFPALIVCRFKGIRTVVHEQNCVAGKVTRIASKIGVLVASGWKKCEGVSESTYVGIPVRKFDLVSREKAAKNMGFSALPGKKNRYVLVTGGSLGSFSLNQSVIEAASMIEFTGLEFFIVGEAGNLDFPENVHFIEPQWDISNFISIADVVICRGGGSSLAEMNIYDVPTIVCPWSHAASDHQSFNARLFVQEKPISREMWVEGQSVNLLTSKLLKLLKLSPVEIKPVSTAIEKSVSTLWREILSHN